jgi:serine/threonine protein kinase
MKKNLQYIIKNYFPYSTDIEIITFGNGHINMTYLVTLKVEDEIKKFILQELNTNIFSVPEKIAKNISAVSDFLKSQPYELQILSPIPTVLDEVYVVENKNYFRLFPYISDSYAPVKCESVAQAFASGKAFGHFFKTLSLLPVSKLETIIPQFHDATLRWEQFSNALKNADKKRFQEAQKEIAFCVQNIDLIAKYKQVISQIPLRATHNDTKITNILFDKNTHNPLCIIDLDTLQPGTILSEFGDMVRTFCNTATEDEQQIENINFQEDIYNALKTGFISETSEILSKIEINLLPFAAKLTIFVQALRFLTDFLNNDIYYKIKFSTHNLRRARNQIALLKQVNI